MIAGLLAALAPIPLILFLGTGFAFERTSTDVVGVNVAALPTMAQELLPMVEKERLEACPELPLLWLVAEVQAESGWDPRAYSSAGAAGLLQMMPGTWVGAGGPDGWDPVSRPVSDHSVWQPQPHLHIALPWMCGNLRMVTRHIQATGKPTDPLVAMAVCHIAGCSRVTGSASGIPEPGEAGCGSDCVSQIRSYLDAIDRWVQAFAAPLALPTSGGGTAQPYPGGSTGCAIPDPTGTGGCITGATAWMLTQVQAALPSSPVSCWDRHAWNPTSDHPLGKACDFTFGRIGHFPGAADKAAGGLLASWLQQNAGALRVAYVIWQGRIWSVQRAAEGWRVYGGGGVYDPTEPTGGHYDHVHVSMAM